VLHHIIPFLYIKHHFTNRIKLPVTDWSASHVLSLPIHPKVTSKNIEFVAKTISEIL